MKKSLTLVVIAVAALLTSACNKDDEKIKVEFATSLYQLEELGSTEVVLKLSAEAGEPLEIPVSFSGSAKKNVDYSVSSDKFVFNAGTKTSSITVTDLGMKNEGTITFNISPKGKYVPGNKYIATVAFPGKETLITNFDITKADLIESLTLTLKLTGARSGDSFKAPSDLDVPVKITGDGKDGIVLSSETIRIQKGSNRGTIKITRDPEFAEGLDHDPVAILEVDRSNSRYSAGDNYSVSIKVHSGLQVPARLVGRWNFAEIIGLVDESGDEGGVEDYFLGEGDDPNLIPKNNEGFFLLITENEETGEVTLRPGGTGDYNNFFREATVTMTHPFHTSTQAVILGEYTTDESNMFESYVLGEDHFVYTYYALSNANRAFSADKETLGASVIAARFNEAGDLIIQFRDYDKPPFGENWWSDNKFDADVFGLCTRYTRN